MLAGFRVQPGEEIDAAAPDDTDETISVLDELKEAGGPDLE